MLFPKLTALVLLSLQALGASAKESSAEEVSQAPLSLAVSVDIKFPDAEVFGVKLINGRATRTVLDFTNNEDESVQILYVGGALSSLRPLAPGSHWSAAIVRNLTSTKYGVEIPAGEQRTFPYAFTTDLNPADLQLQIVAVVENQDGMKFQLQAYNGTVNIVEAPTSFFDPQIIFLYLFLLTAFVGTLYFVYKTWIRTLFPQSRRSGKGAKRPSGGSKKAVPQEQTSGGEGTAVTTQSEPQKLYDESWIPEHHINPPTAKRVKGGASSKAKTKVGAE